MSNSTYTALVPTPNRRAMNTGLSASKVSTLRAVFGDFPDLPVDCGTNKNKIISSMLETRDVGPFRATGIKPALDSLERIFAAVKRDHPDLYKLVGTAGMHCYRRVRGGRNPSNHCAGTAIDLTIGGVLPGMDYSPETPEMIPNGFVILYAYFHAEGWFWAAGYAGGRVDAMHFEVADQTLREWAARDFKTPPIAPRLFCDGRLVDQAYSVYDRAAQKLAWYCMEGALAVTVGKSTQNSARIAPVAQILDQWGLKVAKYTSKLSTQGTAYIRTADK